MSPFQFRYTETIYLHRNQLMPPYDETGAKLEPSSNLEGNDRKTIRFEQLFRVGWSDIDANAHMGNSSYLDYSSNIRMLFFSGHGFTVSRFASEKFGPVVVRDELVYRKELRLMDEFKVDFEAVGLSQDGVRFRVRNTFRNASNDDDVFAVVTSDGVWFDLEQRKPRKPPQDMTDLMRALQRCEDYAEIPSKGVT